MPLWVVISLVWLPTFPSSARFKYSLTPSAFVMVWSEANYISEKIVTIPRIGAVCDMGMERKKYDWQKDFQHHVLHHYINVIMLDGLLC